MRQKDILVLGVLGLSLLLAMPALANYKMVNGGKDFYFGHISYVEIKHDGKDPVVFREGQERPEVALLNLPLGPGDVIQTSDGRRCEVQFDNGTIVRLDYDTELKIETILAPSLSTAKKISNLLLPKGQIYVMYKKYDSLEIFQIITPSAAVKLAHHTIATIRHSKEGTDIQVERGKAHILYGEDKSNPLEAKLKTRERTVVTPFHQAAPASYEEGSDFLTWNASINENFRVLHEESFLPKPIQKLPKAVVYFAQRYGNLYGEWLWHPLYGYVWRPYYNDFYPWGTWHPLYYGSWAVYQGELFWIPEEPWGWVPYHLGIWMWDPKKGWLWLPGSMFAPAWAVWDFYYGVYYWRAWSLFDWYYGPSAHWPVFSLGFYYGPGYRADFPPETHARDILQTIRKDQLQRKKSVSMPIPKEMKKALQTTITALERGDENVLSSLTEIARRAVVVRKEDLSSPRLREKTIPFEQFLRQTELLRQDPIGLRENESAAVSREALKTIQRSQVMAELEFRALTLGRRESDKENRSISRQEVDFSFIRSSSLPEPRGEFSRPRAPESLRFRDWNPDVRTAIQMGVRISYSSRSNEVSCPELGLASRSMSLRTRVAEHSFGGFPSAMRGEGSGGYSPSSSSASTSGVSSSSSSGASRSGAGTSRAGGQEKK